MDTGKLQRKWSEQKPLGYDKETRLVCFDIKNEPHVDEKGQQVPGFSYVQVQIDPVIDYGHIKSQLIEAGFAQKDEFGLLMNGLGVVLGKVEKAKDFTEFKAILQLEEIIQFRAFCEFRELCATVAHEVVDNYSLVK